MALLPSPGDGRPTAPSPLFAAFKPSIKKRSSNFIKYENDIRENSLPGDPDSFGLRVNSYTPYPSPVSTLPSHSVGQSRRIRCNTLPVPEGTKRRATKPFKKPHRQTRSHPTSRLKVTCLTRNSTKTRKQPKIQVRRVPDEGRYYRNHHKRSSSFSMLYRLPLLFLS